MDKSKGEPVISVKTKSKERVCFAFYCFDTDCLASIFEMASFIFFYFRALRVVTVSLRVKKGRTFCHLTKSKSKESGSVKGKGNERLEKWRGADTLGN